VPCLGATPCVDNNILFWVGLIARLASRFMPGHESCTTPVLCKLASPYAGRRLHGSVLMRMCGGGSITAPAADQQRIRRPAVAWRGGPHRPPEANCHRAATNFSVWFLSRLPLFWPPGAPRRSLRQGFFADPEAPPCGRPKQRSPRLASIARRLGRFAATLCRSGGFAPAVCGSPLQRSPNAGLLVGEQTTGFCDAALKRGPWPAWGRARDGASEDLRSPSPRGSAQSVPAFLVNQRPAIAKRGSRNLSWFLTRRNRVIAFCIRCGLEGSAQLAG